jgi:hypothetical protein
MYTFLVLGLIPGTNIQISFQAWLVIMAVLPFAVRGLRSPMRRLLELGKAAEPRLPLPASQVHQRIRPAAR